MTLAIKKDGILVALADDISEAIKFLHQHQPNSYDYALRWGGYAVQNPDGTPALEPYSKR